jgi:hypothetical protein
VNLELRPPDVTIERSLATQRIRGELLAIIRLESHPLPFQNRQLEQNDVTVTRTILRMKGRARKFPRSVWKT